ncbi:hypothetical protein AWZ03_007670 [Drosophila navojoa]|uniref:Uncharacterized protein n=1 Tax=Drosophila navojoa TaxID=7232 RepID=A0A484BD64_DRONA|nr:hypothetical protein AWZ03_007670 [Drosophila navojoa]
MLTEKYSQRRSPHAYNYRNVLPEAGQTLDQIKVMHGQYFIAIFVQMIMSSGPDVDDDADVDGDADGDGDGDAPRSAAIVTSPSGA